MKKAYKIDHSSYFYGECEIVEYDKNILLLKFVLQFLFLYISPNYKNYEFSRVLLLDLGLHFSSIQIIIKMNNNNICLYFEQSLHFIKFNYDIIFNDNNPLQLNPKQYCEIIDSKDLIAQKIIKIIPVYYDNINKKNKVKKIIGISFIIDKLHISHEMICKGIFPLKDYFNIRYLNNNNNTEVAIYKKPKLIMYI